MDAARAAKRVSGVESVSIVYRRTRQFMPADHEEIKLALSEGIMFKELLSPLTYKDNKLVCGEMVLGEKDATGR
jgi:putative selenate reductase